MFLNRFDFHLPSAGARYRQDELRGSDFMLLRMRPEGAIVDEALERPRGSRFTEWSRIRFVLDGPLHVRRGAGVLVQRGAAHGSSEFRSEAGRSLTRSSDWLDLYWRNGSAIGERLTEGVIARLSPKSFERVERLAAALTEQGTHATLQATRDVLDDLRAHGLPFGTLPTNEVDPSPPELVRAVWQLASHLSEQPMAIDLFACARRLRAPRAPTCEPVLPAVSPFGFELAGVHQLPAPRNGRVLHGRAARPNGGCEPIPRLLVSDELLPRVSGRGLAVTPEGARGSALRGLNPLPSQR